MMEYLQEVEDKLGYLEALFLHFLVKELTVDKGPGDHRAGDTAKMSRCARLETCQSPPHFSSFKYQGLHH